MVNNSIKSIYIRLLHDYFEREKVVGDCVFFRPRRVPDGSVVNMTGHHFCHHFLLSALMKVIVTSSRCPLALDYRHTIAFYD